MRIRWVSLPVGSGPRPRALVEPLEGRLFLHAGHDHAGMLPEDSSWDEHVLPEPQDRIPIDKGTHANPSPWTTGNKTVLYIRVAYADTPTTEPQTLASAQDSMTRMDAYMQANSFGLTSFTTTFTDLVVLPQTLAYYTDPANYDGALRRDALAAAKEAGIAAGQDWDYTHYNLDAVRFSGAPGGGYAGKAYVGGRGVWLKSSSMGVAAHEFGHNLGLWHSNFWAPTDPQTVVGPGANDEYGDSFDVMGSSGSGGHFNAWQKNVIGWIPDANVTTAREDGRYRIHAFDLGGSLDPSLPYLLKFPKDRDREYTVEFRQGSGFTSNRWVMNGVGIHWDRWANSNNGSQLIDTNPSSPDGRSDSYVVLGRTYTDAVSGLHVTPVASGTVTNAAGATLPYMDVQVNFAGSRAGRAPAASFTASALQVPVNTPVTFTATASDPDGDPLAYHWDFGDRTFGTNSATTTKTWSTAGERRVRLTVSDMKGRTTTVSTIVRVGNPASVNRISGRVTDAAGNPVADVRVGVAGSSAVQAYTDSDGTYTLPGLSASGSYTITAAKVGWAVSAPGFTNPVSTAGNPANIDFVMSQVLYQASGRVVHAGAPVAGAVVTDGVRSAVTDAAGQYSLQVPIGTHTLTAAHPGMEFAPEAVTVDFANVTRDLTTLGPGTGVLREWWTAISGSSVGTLTANPRYPNNPTGSQVISGATPGAVFAAPVDWADNYGTRMRGYYVAPATGSYTFWISSDDSSELWLSTDANPLNRRRVANVSGSTDPEQWTKYTSQRSAPISLVAGQKYFIEAIQKEATGRDNLAVGADLPGGVIERPIPLHRILPWGTDVSDVTAPAVTASAFHYASGPQRVTFTFTEDVGTTVGASDLVLRNVGTGETVPTESIRSSYDAPSQTVTFTFPGFSGGVLPNGSYRATLAAAGVHDLAANRLAAESAADFFALAGDIDRDRSVTATDFALLAGNFGKTGQSFAGGDLNGDGKVDAADFALLAANFGKSVPAPQAVAVATAPTAVTAAPRTAPAAATAPVTRRPAPAARPARRAAPGAPTTATALRASHKKLGKVDATGLSAVS